MAVGDEAKDLARKMIKAVLIPKAFPEDALHVAICALNGIDYLVTWNCAHLANATIRRQVERFLEKADYACPAICTPEELMET